MPHDRSALIDQLRAHLKQQRFDSVVIHNYCRSAGHFLTYLARRKTAVDTAKPDHVSSYLRFAAGDEGPARGWRLSRAPVLGRPRRR